jgi:hypothetical protein
VGKPYKIKTSKLCCNKKKKSNKIAEESAYKSFSESPGGPPPKPVGKKTNKVADESQIYSRDTSGIMMQ